MKDSIGITKAAVLPEPKHQKKERKQTTRLRLDFNSHYGNQKVVGRQTCFCDTDDISVL